MAVYMLPFWLFTFMNGTRKSQDPDISAALQEYNITLLALLLAMASLTGSMMVPALTLRHFSTMAESIRQFSMNGVPMTANIGTGS